MPEIISVVQNAIGLLKEHGINATEARPEGIEMTNFILSRVFGADGGDLIEALVEDSRTTTPSSKIQESLDQPVFEINQQEFAQTITLWDNFKSSMLSYFADFDILICPVNATTAISLGEEEDLQGYTYTSAFNLTGWPGVVIRGGQDNNGMPIGIQILARPFREDHCLALAQWLEAKLGDFPKPNIFAK